MHTYRPYFYNLCAINSSVTLNDVYFSHCFGNGSLRPASYIYTTLLTHMRSALYNTHKDIAYRSH